MALKVNHTASTAQVGDSIVADLVEGNMHEAFCHLKGRHQAATETQARPCFQTMEKQMAERINIHR
jgi:hypothetical protein